ncbi:MAG: chromosomal replication initiator protein DnaA [Clostridia bacterium]|nr:chromosomal replication initiator protein DnaA [Clostridia bacterium]
MNFTPEQQAAWERALKMLEDNIPLVSYNAFIKPLQLYSVTNDTLVIIAENAFNLNHLKNRYYTQLFNAVRTVFGRPFELQFYTQEDMKKNANNISVSSLNSKYTFDNFVVGPANSLAYHASLAVAEDPSNAYNPLFIYGGVGLGKTHLMNAIGNFIIQQDPTANILFTTSETFTNELIDSIVSKKGTGNLRNRMRNVDVLMVDDIQFLSKTTTTQEEFFHTFNDLHAKGKQIIICSDRPPKELPAIEDRLRSRFEWGLIVDIQKPDFETRVAILKKKADSEHIEIPYEVIEYIAQCVESNIRELEGSLTRIYAHSQLLGTPITLDLAKSSLSQLIKVQEEKKLTAEGIMAFIAEQYNITVDDITSKKRNREIALPRQIAMYMCREMIGLSTTAIGRSFGNRDHTTVMHGCDKVSDTIKTDFSFKRRIEELMAMVKNG